ncbi:MAG: nicotinamide-nucleotide amidohydrolase family protein [Duncaniella sp.]|nr:nicotinamide-nucleotide amidohydrolase family protein [Duncaniella sp.]
MMAEAVFPALLERFPSDVNIAHRTLMVTDYTESALAMKIAPWEEALPSFLHLAYLPKPGLIRLRLDGHHDDDALLEAEMTRQVEELKALLGPAVLADRDMTPAEILLDRARRAGLTVATAESCTGGNIAHELTLIPGASDVVAGGVVSYSNEVKVNVLGVSADDIARHGAVSIPVVRQMAEGAARVTGASLTMATSGIAGPGGGSPEKPVGTVCICARLADKEIFETARFNGSRSRIISSATTRALILACRLLG